MENDRVTRTGGSKNTPKHTHTHVDHVRGELLSLLLGSSTQLLAVGVISFC